MAKVILIIEGKMDITVDFLSDDYQKPYKILNMLNAQELSELKQEIDTFQSIELKNIRF